MPATAIDRVTRYTAPGVLKINFLPAVAAGTGIPTRSEINAGQDVSCEVAGYTGFTKSVQYVEVPDLCSDTSGKLVGRASYDDSSIDFYADVEGDDIRSVLTDGDEWWIAFLWGGDVPTSLMDVFHARVSTHQVVGDVPGQNAVIVRYAVSIISAAQDAAVPAAP